MAAKVALVSSWWRRRLRSGGEEKMMRQGRRGAKDEDGEKGVARSVVVLKAQAVMGSSWC